MARKTKQTKTAASRRAASRNIAASGKPERERIIDAFLALLAEKTFQHITLNDVATTAGVTLADMREQFSSPLAILAGYLKSVDRAVLAAIDEDMREEPPRERLFDVLMRRLEALAPHKTAIRSLARSAANDPALALALNGLALRSMQWMLAAADIACAGPKGMMRAQGLALTYASVMRVWLDDDADNARTMAALDRALERGRFWSEVLDGLWRIPEGAFRMRARWRARRRERRRYDERHDGDYDRPAA